MYRAVGKGNPGGRTGVLEKVNRKVQRDFGARKDNSVTAAHAAHEVLDVIRDIRLPSTPHRPDPSPEDKSLAAYARQPRRRQTVRQAVGTLARP